MKISIKKFLVLSILLITLLLNNFNIVYAETTSEPEITSRSAILIDNKTGQVLYNKDADEKMFPASTTKILTAIIVLENCSLDETVTASYNAISNIPEGYVTAEIQGEEQFTVEQLLEMLLVLSANDSANVLAEYVGGSIDSFVSMMNTKANEFGLTNSHFTNPYGLQDENHYSTAHDLAIIMQHCLENEDFRRIAGSVSCSIPATNKSGVRSYTSTNHLILPDNPDYYSYVTVGKTGFTTEAGHCLVSCAYKNDLELICVILGGSVVNGVSTRFSESKALYEYGFNNFSLKNIANPGDVITEIEVSNGSPDTKSLDLAFTDNIYALVNNSDLNTNYTPNIQLNPNISAPITQGDVLGKVVYTIDGIQYESDIIATHNVETSQLLQFVLNIGGIIIVLLIIFEIFFSTKKKRRNRKGSYCFLFKKIRTYNNNLYAPIFYFTNIL